VLSAFTCVADSAGGGRPLRRNNSNESFSSLSLAIKAMTRFGPSSYGNLQVRLIPTASFCLVPFPSYYPMAYSISHVAPDEEDLAGF
jgi:hypothetical protein